MKRATMELGGHAPVIVFNDADVDAAAKILSGAKYRNERLSSAWSPTRFMVQEGVYDKFVEKFVENTKTIKVGNGLDPESRMGALANPRSRRCHRRNGAGRCRQGRKAADRRQAHRQQGLLLRADGDHRCAKECARAMNDEPFGPMAMISPFAKFDDAAEEANRLPFGLASYAFTSSTKTATAIGAAIEAGMVAINSVGLALPEVPFGGIKDSGYGSEGGTEAMEGYFNTKFITQTGV